jgi:hypothetical protein
LGPRPPAALEQDPGADRSEIDGTQPPGPGQASLMTLPAVLLHAHCSSFPPTPTRRELVLSHEGLPLAAIGKGSVTSPDRMMARSERQKQSKVE